MATSKIFSSSLISGRQATATVTPTTGTDFQGFQGEVTFVLDSSQGTGTAPTLNVKLQSSSVINGTGDAFADIAGATFTTVTGASGAIHSAITLNVDDHKRFIRAVATIAGTSPVFALAVTAVGNNKYQ